MSFNINELKKNASSNFPKLEPIASGTYMARLVQIIGLGIQESEWKGEIKVANKAFLTWELPDETVEYNGEQRPRWLSKEYTLSINEKSSLTQVVQALAPNGGVTSLTDLLGKPCMVTVGKTSTGNSKIVGVVAAMKGVTVKEVYDSNKIVAFDFDNPDLTVLPTLPPFLLDKMKDAKNYNGFIDNAPPKFVEKQPTAKTKTVDVTDFDDDVPF